MVGILISQATINSYRCVNCVYGRVIAMTPSLDIQPVLYVNSFLCVVLQLIINIQPLFLRISYSSVSNRQESINFKKILPSITFYRSFMIITRRKLNYFMIKQFASMNRLLLAPPTFIPSSNSIIFSSKIG